MALHHYVFAVFFSVLIVVYPSTSSVLSWITGSSTPTTPRYPVDVVKPLSNAGQRNPYPEESGECSHWGYATPTSYTPPDNSMYSPGVGLSVPSNLIGSHRRVPVGSIVAVTNMRNGKTVSIRVVPPKTIPVFGRVMDLSPAAFAQLEQLSEGVFTCSVNVIQPFGRTETNSLSSYTFDNNGRVRVPPLMSATSYVPMQTSFVQGDDLVRDSGADSSYY